MPDRLQGRTALVTGGGSGIGRAASLAFAREGAKVVVADLVAESGRDTAQMITGSGGEAIFVQVDVRIASHVQAMVNRAVEFFGRIDCAFNNAGVSGRVRVPTPDWTEEQWDEIIDINVKGVWLCMKYELPQMVKQGGGAIVNTASVASMVAIRGASGYIASKHAVLGLTRAAALEYAQQGIRVNAVCPGYIRTPMIEGILARNPAREAQINAEEPVGRMGTPEEVAEAAVWLCTDAASFMTGHPLVVDGGVTAQ